MKRRYDSTRRRRAAERTRNQILRAALKLHWEGVTGFGPLAEEAGCSVPTVRKHFPTKEALYRHCTRAFAETLRMPDPEALAKTPGAGERLRECVGELCRIHEAMYGYAWHSAHLRGNSPVLDAVMREYEGLADAISRIAAPPGTPRAPVVRGLLDFLTYRALRLSGHLPPHRVKDALLTTIRALPDGDGGPEIEDISDEGAQG